MPARSDLTTAQLSEYLNNEFGPEINADNVRAACDHFGVTTILLLSSVYVTSMSSVAPGN